MNIFLKKIFALIMFLLNIFNKSDKYSVLEKKCNCCSEKYASECLIKDNAYFNGKRKICNKCLGYMNNILNEYSSKYGELTSHDRLYLNNNLYTYIQKIYGSSNNIKN